MNRKQYYSRHNVSPYLKKLGKRLFGLALELSRYKEKPTKQRIVDLIREKKTKNQTIPLSLACELIAECVEKMKANRIRTRQLFKNYYPRYEDIGRYSFFRTNDIPIPIWETPIIQRLDEYRKLKLQAEKEDMEQEIYHSLKILDNLLKKSKDFDGNLCSVQFMDKIRNTNKEDSEKVLEAVKISIGAMSAEMKLNAEDFGKLGNRKVAV